MAHLGSISGDGSLIAKKHSIGPAQYRIDIWSDGVLKEAGGYIEADDNVIFKAFNAGTVQLALSNGSQIAVIVTNHSLGTGEATIKVSGPVPGF